MASLLLNKILSRVEAVFIELARGIKRVVQGLILI